MIELLVAVVILSLFIVVAVSSVYEHRANNSKRKAIARLNEVAEWLQMQYAKQPDYRSLLPPGWSTESTDASYRISLSATGVKAVDPDGAFPALDKDRFTLQADPVDSNECGSLLLDHAGRRGVTGTGASVADCWK